MLYLVLISCRCWLDSGMSLGDFRSAVMFYSKPAFCPPPPPTAVCCKGIACTCPPGLVRGGKQILTPPGVLWVGSWRARPGLYGLVGAQPADATAHVADPFSQRRIHLLLPAVVSGSTVVRHGASTFQPFPALSILVRISIAFEATEFCEDSWNMLDHTGIRKQPAAAVHTIFTTVIAVDCSSIVAVAVGCCAAQDAEQVLRNCTLAALLLQRFHLEM